MRIAAAALGLALTACAAPYENARFGFGVSVPRDWTVSESDNGDGLRMDAPGLRVSVWGMHNAWDVETLDDLRRMYGHLVPGPLRDVRSGGLEGVEYDNFKPGEPVVGLQRILLRGDVLIGLALSGADARTPEAERIFHRICDSFYSR